MWCFWEFVFPRKNVKSACFGSAVTFDSRRLHTTHLAVRIANRQVRSWQASHGECPERAQRVEGLMLAGVVSVRFQTHALASSRPTMASSPCGARLHPAVRGRRAVHRSHRRSSRADRDAPCRRGSAVHSQAPAGRAGIQRGFADTARRRRPRAPNQAMDPREEGSAHRWRLAAAQARVRTATDVAQAGLVDAFVESEAARDLLIARAAQHMLAVADQHRHVGDAA